MNALKVLSMRLRGTTASKLEEEGEDTDGLVTNASKLYDIVLKLTSVNGGQGVKIINDDGDYKSTYQILNEISQVWDKMDDQSQSALLETIAGKTRGAAAAAILQNGEILRESYEMSLESSGATEKAMEVAMSSIEKHLSQISNEWSAMWQSFIDSDIVNMVLDLSKALMSLTNSLGGMKTLVSLAATLGIYFKAVKPAITEATEAGVYHKKTMFDNLVFTRENMEASNESAQANLNEANSRRVNSNAAQDETNQINKNTAAKMNQNIKVRKFGMASSGIGMALSATGSMIGGNAGNVVNGIGNVATMAGMGASMLGIPGAIIGGVVGAGTTIGNVIKNHRDKLQKELDDFNSSINQYNSSLKEISNNSSNLRDLLKSFNELKAGVDDNNKNLKLSDDKYEEYLKTVNGISEIYGDLVERFDSEGNPILNELASNIDKASKAYENNAKIVNASSILSGGKDNGGFAGLDIFKNKWGKSDATNIDAWNMLLGDSDEAASYYMSLAKKVESGEISYLDMVDEINNHSGNKIDSHDMAQHRLEYEQDKQELSELENEARQLIQAYALYRDDYTNMTEDQKQLFDLISSKINVDFINQFDADVQDMFEQIVTTVNNSDFIGFGDFINYDIKDDDLNKAANYLTQFAEKLGEYWGISTDDILKMFGFEKIISARDNLNQLIPELALKSTDGSFGGTRVAEKQLWDFVNNNSVNTQNEIARLNQAIVDSNYDLEKAFEKYLEGVTPKNIYKNVEEYINSDAFSQYREELLNLARSGTLTKEMLDSKNLKDFGLSKDTRDAVEKFQSIMDETGYESEEILRQIMNILDSQEKLSAVQNGLSGLASAYTEWKDNSYLSASTLVGLRDIFGNLDGYDNFEQLAGNPMSKAEDVQAAFDDVVSSYLYSQAVLDEVISATDDEIAAFRKNLATYGIENADEIVDLALKFGNAIPELINNINSPEEFAQQFVEANKDANEQDLDNYAQYLAYKTALDNTWLGDWYKVNEDTINELNTKYGIDVNNFKHANYLKVRNELETQKDIIKAREQAYIQEMKTNPVIATDYYKFIKPAFESQTTEIDNLIANLDAEFNAKLMGNEDVEKLFKSYKSSFNGNEFNQHEKSAQQFDWIERALLKVEREITDIERTANNAYTTFSSRNKSLTEELGKTTDQITLQKKAIQAYEKEMSDLNLSQEYINKIKNGEMDIESVKDTDLADKIQKYQSYYDKVEELKDKIEDEAINRGSIRKSIFNNIAAEYDGAINLNDIGISQIQSEINRLTSYKGFNLNAIESDYDKMAADERKNAKLYSDRTRLLKQTLKEAVDSGDIEAYSQEWYDLTAQIYDSEEKQRECFDKIANYAKKSFSAISTFYDSLISHISANTNRLNSQIDLLRNSGHAIQASIYTNLANDNIKMRRYYVTEKGRLERELQQSINDGTIQEGSKDWHDAISAIENVQASIDGCDASLLQFYNDLQELDYSNFSKLIGVIENLNSETQYFLNLMSDREMYDADTASITDYGITSLGLHQQNYQSYEEEAKMYGDKIIEINQKIAEDPSNQLLIDKKNEYLESQRQAILNSENEKKAMIDLAKQGYDAYMNSINKTISKLKELHNEERSEYEYQKSIADKTKNISSLQRQLMAFDGNDSEEARAKIQQLTVELQEANQDLEETQYDKYISDQENMLDKLTDEMQEFIDELFRKPDELLTKIEQSLDGQDGTIYKTLNGLADKYDISLSNAMKNIWKNEQEVPNVISTLVTQQKNINTASTNIQSMLRAICEKLGVDVSLNPYAKGTTKISSNQLALIDELGDELVVRAGNKGDITALTKGSGVIPADLTANLMEWGKLNPMQLLSSVKVPNVTALSGGNIGSIENTVNVSLDLSNVKNSEDFIRELQTNKKLERVIQSITIDQLAGKNSLTKMKY